MPDPRETRAAEPRPGEAHPALHALDPKAVAPHEGDSPSPAGAAPAAEAAPSAWSCPFCGHELHVEVTRCAVCGALAVPPSEVAIDVLRGNARTVYLLQAITPLCGISAVA